MSGIEESWDFDSNYSHFADRNTKLFCCHGGKEFIAVQHSPVMTFDEYWNLLEKRVRLFCHSYLSGIKSRSQNTINVTIHI